MLGYRVPEIDFSVYPDPESIEKWVKPNIFGENIIARFLQFNLPRIFYPRYVLPKFELSCFGYRSTLINNKTVADIFRYIVHKYYQPHLYVITICRIAIRCKAVSSTFPVLSKSLSTGRVHIEAQKT